MIDKKLPHGGGMGEVRLLREIARLLQGLGEDEAEVLVRDRDGLKRYIRYALAEMRRGKWAEVVEDKDVPNYLVPAVLMYREMAVQLEYEGPVVFALEEGVSLWRNGLWAPFLNSGTQYSLLNEWRLSYDASLKPAFAFCVPRMLGGGMIGLAEERSRMDDFASKFKKGDKSLKNHRCGTHYHPASAVAGVMGALMGISDFVWPTAVHEERDAECHVRTYTFVSGQGGRRRLVVGHMMDGDNSTITLNAWDGGDTRRSVGLGSFPFGIEPVRKTR